MSPSRSRRGRGGQGGHEPRTRIRLRELRALELQTQGWSQHQIAAELGISQPAVSKLLKRVELRLLMEMRDTVERQKARQTLRLEHLYAEAMRAWDASKTDATRRRQRKTDGAGGGAGSTVAELVIENSHGDPRYLEQARKSQADLRKVWGVDAPEKVDVRALPNPYDGLTEEELRAEILRQQRLLPAETTDAAPAPRSTAATSDEEEDPHGHH